MAGTKGAAVKPPVANKIGGNNSRAGAGRPKGSPNKTTALLKDAILLAAEKAGGKDGLVGYLKLQALENPGPFMSLLGRVMPTQIADQDGNALHISVTIGGDVTNG